MSIFGLFERKQARQRRQRLAGEWSLGRSTDEGESKLFESGFELAEAARSLADNAGIRGTAPVTAATLGCATVALGSQAIAIEKLRSLVVVELADPDQRNEVAPDLEQLDRMLRSVAETLRFASEQTDGARASAARVLDRQRSAALLEA